MSGPVTTADVDPTAPPPTPGGVEVHDNRATRVGAAPVQRVLPQRSRRTVGAWCFFDIGGPVSGASGGMGIGPHPHIGLQTVTWVLDGELLHRDSLGSEQLIRPGELNLMTAGHGIVHAEEHTSDGPVHLAQLWVAQPSATRDGPSAFEHHADLPHVELDGATATVFIGALRGASSPARRDTDHMAIDLDVRGDTVLPVDRTYEHAVVPLDGAVEVHGETVELGRWLYVGPGRDEILIRAAAAARLIVLGGVPFDETVSMWWNYVARSHEEITEAHREWTARTARFVVPASSLAPIDVGPPPWST